MAEKSSNVMKAINPHVQESEGTPSTRNMKKTSRHIIITLKPVIEK